MIIAIVFTILIIYLSWKLIEFLKFRNKINKFAGPNGLYLLGNSHQLELDGHKFHLQLFEYSNTYKNSPSFRIWIGPIGCVLCHTTDSVEKILASNKIINKSTLYSFLHPWLGSGLLTSYGDKWRSRRKLLTPAFHFRILNDFLPIMNEQADILVNQIIHKCSPNDFNEPLDIHHLFTMYALDVISETAMGVQLNAQENSESEYVTSICQLSKMVMDRLKNPFHLKDFFYRMSHQGREFLRIVDEVHKFTDNVIQQRKAMYFSQDFDCKPKRLAFLDLLLEYQQSQGGNLTDQDLREEVDTFMFEGHDTTATSLTWTLLLLAQHPQIQEKVQQELDEVIGGGAGCGAGDLTITMDHINKLQYLDKVLKESLRLYPSVPFIARECEEDMDVCGQIIPKGATVIVLIAALHRNASVFPNPDEFHPERFDLNEEKRSPFAQVAFSAGPRNCIGAKFATMEEKVILSHLLRRFSVRSDVVEAMECQPAAEVILRPLKPVPVYFTMRS